jgi:gliding motility-associated-like protein
MKTLTIICFILVSCGTGVYAQDACTALGQNPETAFPVCATSVFVQQVVPACGVDTIPVDCHEGDDVYMDKNPYWYKFTCFASGTLGFVITPNNRQDDYDWQLFDITNHDPRDVYKDPSLFVAANWSGEKGKTGASSAGKTLLVCGSYSFDHSPGPYRPLFSKMPVLKKGHHYLLLISHFLGDNQSGYRLSFGGGTAIITDTTPPRLIKAFPDCDATSLAIRLNKKMVCKSLANDGSDFIITPGNAKVTAAASTDCKRGFDMDSLTLTLDRPLPPGDYTLSVQNGTDGNTLMDYCDNSIPVGEKLPFTVRKPGPTPMDTIPAVGCAPKVIQVEFAGLMDCNSIAADGSDFGITGPSPVIITDAKGINCVNGKSFTIAITLASPIVKGGIYTLTLKKGSDGNTVISQCGFETPEGSALVFKTKDTVSAGIAYREEDTCNRVTIYLSNNGNHEINQWLWALGNGTIDTLQHVSYNDTTFEPQQIRLTVSNGVCEDSASAIFQPDRDWHLKALFEEPSFVCPNDEAVFIDHSLGNITSYQWNFGNGNTSFLETPPRQQYPQVVRTQNFPVALIVQNTTGCSDTAVKQLQVINNCFIAVPTAFTPNGDGMNDYLYPLNAYKARDLDFRVYNRYGQLVFETKDWTRKWDGTFHGVPQPMGSYVWMLTYINTDTNEKVFKKGSTLLIR